MLKTKLAYMALGAVIASSGYFIGTLNNLNAEDEVTRVKKLIVSESITIEASDEVHPTTILRPGRIFMTGKSFKSVSIDADDIIMRTNPLDQGNRLDDTAMFNWIRLSTHTDTPFIDI